MPVMKSKSKSNDIDGKLYFSITKYIRHLPESLEDISRIRAMAEERAITLEKEISEATGRVKTRLGSALKNVTSNITNLTLQYNLLMHGGDAPGGARLDSDTIGVAPVAADAMDVDQHGSQVSVQPISEAPIHAASDPISSQDAPQGNSVACAHSPDTHEVHPVAVEHPDSVDSGVASSAAPSDHTAHVLARDAVSPPHAEVKTDILNPIDAVTTTTPTPIPPINAATPTNSIPIPPVPAPTRPASPKSRAATPELQYPPEPITIVQNIVRTGDGQYRITTSAERSTPQAPAGKSDTVADTMEVDGDDGLSDEDAEGEADPDAEGTLFAGPSAVHVTMVTEKKNDPPVRTHLPEYWEKLTNREKRTILDHAKAQLAKFYKTNMPLRDNIRAWARRHSEFLPISAMHSRKLALSMFILNNGRTCCHYHVHLDRISAVNDVAVNESDSAQPFNVTGVPYEPNPTPIRHPNYLQRDPDDFSGGRNPNFTLERVLEFFPLMDEETGERALHCGCPMEEALIDFYFWKVVQIESHSYEAIETMGRGIKPRFRLYYIVILKLFDIQFDDLFQYDTEDRAIDTLDARMRQINVWKDVVKNIQKTRSEKQAEKEKERKRLAQQKLARARKEIEDLEAGEVDFDD